MELMKRTRRMIPAMLLMAGMSCWVSRGAAQVSTDSAVVESRIPDPVLQKDPRLAGALSVFVPGLGHMYAGETVKGGVLTGLFAGSIIGVISADIGVTNGSIRPGGWSAIALLGGVYLYALIDAPFAAHRANSGGAEGGLLRFRAEGLAVALDAGAGSPGVVGARIRVEF